MLSHLLVLLTLAAEPAHQPLHLQAPLQDKNFYLLSLLGKEPVVRADPALAALGDTKRKALQSGPAALKWTDSEIESSAEVLRKLYLSNQSLRLAIDAPLTSSGAYVRYRSKPGAEVLAQARIDAAHGMNLIIDVYGFGKPPRYPEIDSVTYDVKSDNYQRLLLQIIPAVLADDPKSLSLFFEPTLR